MRSNGRTLSQHVPIISPGVRYDYSFLSHSRGLFITYYILYLLLFFHPIFYGIFFFFLLSQKFFLAAFVFCTQHNSSFAPDDDEERAAGRTPHPTTTTRRRPPWSFAASGSKNRTRLPSRLPSTLRYIAITLHIIFIDSLRATSNH